MLQPLPAGSYGTLANRPHAFCECLSSPADDRAEAFLNPLKPTITPSFRQSGTFAVANCRNSLVSEPVRRAPL